MSGTIKGVLIVGIAIATLGCANRGLRDISQFLPRLNSGPDQKFRAARKQEKLGRVSRARKTYQKLYEDDPGNADVCHRLAIVCAKMGDAALSKRYFLEAIRLAPDNAQIIADYGYAKLLNRDFKSAEALLNKAISMEPDNMRAKNNLAIVRKRRKDRGRDGKPQTQLVAAQKTTRPTQPKKRTAQTTSRENALTQRPTRDSLEPTTPWPAPIRKTVETLKVTRKTPLRTQPTRRPIVAAPPVIKPNVDERPVQKFVMTPLPPRHPLKPAAALPKRQLSNAAPFPETVPRQRTFRPSPPVITRDEHPVANVAAPVRQTSHVSGNPGGWTVTQPKSSPKTEPMIAQPSIRPDFAEDSDEPTSSRPDFVEDDRDSSASIPVVADPPSVKQKSARIRLTPLEPPSKPWRIKIRPATRE